MDDQGYASAQHDPAEEQWFVFPDVATANAAARDIKAGMATCQSTSQGLQRAKGVTIDAKVTATTDTPAGTAWSRSWFGLPGISAAGPQIDHYYVIQRDKTIVVFSFAQLGATPAFVYDTAGDTAVLAMLNSQSAN